MNISSKLEWRIWSDKREVLHKYTDEIESGEKINDYSLTWFGNEKLMKDKKDQGIWICMINTPNRLDFYSFIVFPLSIFLN